MDKEQKKRFDELKDALERFCDAVREEPKTMAQREAPAKIARADGEAMPDDIGEAVFVRKIPPRTPPADYFSYPPPAPSIDLLVHAIEDLGDELKRVSQFIADTLEFAKLWRDEMPEEQEAHCQRRIDDLVQATDGDASELDKYAAEGKKYCLAFRQGEFWRIQACRDFGDSEDGCYRMVKKGDFGGLVESPENLAQNGKCWISAGALVYGNARIEGDALVADNAKVYGNAHIAGNALVYGNARVEEDALIIDNAKVYGNARVAGDALVGGKAVVEEDAFVGGKAVVLGKAVLRGEFHFAPKDDDGSITEGTHVGIILDTPSEALKPEA